jgi:hypothetical protein
LKQNIPSSHPALPPRSHYKNHRSIPERVSLVGFGNRWTELVVAEAQVTSSQPSVVATLRDKPLSLLCSCLSFRVEPRNRRGASSASMLTWAIAPLNLAITSDRPNSSTAARNRASGKKPGFLRAAATRGNDTLAGAQLLRRMAAGQRGRQPQRLALETTSNEISTCTRETYKCAQRSRSMMNSSPRLRHSRDKEKSRLVREALMLSSSVRARGGWRAWTAANPACKRPRGAGRPRGDPG